MSVCFLFPGVYLQDLMSVNIAAQRVYLNDNKSFLPLTFHGNGIYVKWFGLFCKFSEPFYIVLLQMQLLLVNGQICAPPIHSILYF